MKNQRLHKHLLDRIVLRPRNPMTSGGKAQARGFLANIHMRLMAIFAVACLTASGTSGMDMRPMWLGTPFMEGWVPETADVVRGVYIANGFPMKGAWAEALAEWKFAMLRINTDKYTTNLPDDEKHAVLRGRLKAFESVVRQGLARLAEETGHPELNGVPIVASGFSRYSGSARDMMKIFPERALGYMNGNGGSGTDEFTNFTVPNMGMQCEWENIFGGGAKDKLLDKWWQRDARSVGMCAIHWRVYHNPNAMSDIGIFFVDELIKARIPEKWDPRTGPCILKAVKVEDGWLGSHQGWRTPADQLFDVDNDNAHIAPVAGFQHNPTRASWLVSERMAWVWRAWSSRFPLASFTEPGWPSVGYFSNPSPPPIGHRESGIRAGKPFIVKAKAHVENVVKIEVYVDTESKGSAETFAGGEAKLGSSRNAEFALEITINEPGVKALMGKYFSQDEKSGWMRPIPIVVKQALPQ